MNHAHPSGAGNETEHSCSCCHTHSHADEEILPQGETILPEGTREARFLIPDMCCPTEERIIRKTLAKTGGIHRLDFNLLRREVVVHHSLQDTGGIIALLNRVGMPPVELGEDKPEVKDAANRFFAHGNRWLLAAAGAAAIGSEIVAWTTGSDSSPLVISLALASILAGGLPTLKKGFLALGKLTLNINFLMSVATIGAVAVGQWPEAAVVVWLFAVAEKIEAMSLDRARNAVSGLMAISPETATVLREEGVWQQVEAAGVGSGEIVRVKPGERIPLDGIVTAGHSSVNQAPITGESVPVEKTEGDRVFAGTVNENGVLEFRVTGDYRHTTLARIVAAVHDAQAQRAPVQRFVDAFAAWYTPVVVVLALLVAVIPPLFFGLQWDEWIYKALVMLVISCPCALVISIPVSVVSGLAAAAHHGILVKGGAFLEAGRKLRTVALDKTGTLTLGKPAVTDVIPLNHHEPRTILQLAASLEENSGHPIAEPVVERWRRESADQPLLPVEKFRNLPGKGLAGEIEGKLYYIGNRRLVEELDLHEEALKGSLDRLEREGKTAVVLTSDRQPVALIGVTDTLRDSGRRAVASLHALGIRTVMLSGDNRATAEAVGAGAGIDDVRGELLPADKLEAVANLQKSGPVGMVGDGINDAPALARADIGFAMGAAGSDTALETADVALMDDDLNKIPDFIRLSRRTGRIIVQNIVFALGTKGAFFALTLAGEATLWMAVFADMGVSLLVVFNSLRLLGFFGKSTRPAAGVDPGGFSTSKTGTCNC